MPAFTTTERLRMLEHVMLHSKLHDADRRIYWYLVMKLLNEETGLAYCANAHLARQLDLTTRTVERCKRKLRALGLVTYVSGKSDHSATSYKLIKHLPTTDTHVGSSGSTKMLEDVRATSTSGVCDTHVGSSPDTHVGSKRRTSDMYVGSSKREHASRSPDIHVGSYKAGSRPRHGDTDRAGKFYARFGSPEQDYADAFANKHGRLSPQRDRYGGCWLDGQWPEETKQ